MPSLKKQTSRKIRGFLLIAGIRLFTFILSKLSRSSGIKLSEGVGKLAFRLVNRHRETAFKNLKMAYKKSKNDEELLQIVQNVFVNQSLNFYDLAATFHFRTKEEFLKIWEIKGEEHLKAAYDQGKGVLISTGHIGSWEFSFIAPSVLGYKTSGVTAPLKDGKINDLVVASREIRGVKNIGRGNGKAYPRVIDALDKGECVMILIDQDIRAKGCFVDFYGMPAFTSIGAAKIAQDAGAPVVSMCTKRLPDNRHRIEFFPAMEMKTSADPRQDLIDNTIRIHNDLEKMIKADPDQWVWFHKRWKRTPEKIKANRVI